MKSEYLREIEPLPDDLLEAGMFRKRLPEAEAKRWRREVAQRKAAIRVARANANIGRSGVDFIEPEPPFGTY